eukprot:6482667-Amphidinium_carterae.2
MLPSGRPFHRTATMHTSVKPPVTGSVDAPSSNKGRDASHGFWRSVDAALKMALRLSTGAPARDRPRD